MYQAPDMTLWRGRINPEKSDLLWHQIIQSLDMTNDIWSPEAKINVALLGFASDEGVRRNFGRVGASQGPEKIRKTCTGLAVHFDNEERSITDAGNVICNGQNLEAASKMLSEKALKLLQNGYFPIVIGGGHETSYPHFKGIRKYIGTNARIGIINFDAHFDMRSYENGAHSGSSFRNLMDDAVREQQSFHYLPIGIRQESNIPSLFEVMRDNQQGYILLEEVQKEMPEVEEKIKDFISAMDRVYLTIDMDCFPAAYAPGVSAAAPDGMLPSEVQSLVRIIFDSGKVISMDVVETNPELDDGRTAKLAATLIYDVVTNCLKE